jgi:hypothetical protein
VAVYQIQSKKMAFDLRSRAVSLASDLKSNIATPDQYAATVRGVHPEFHAYFGEIGHLFGLKTAGCPGKSATPIL